MDTPKLNVLTRAMTAYAWRMQAVASNVANLDTPGYKRLSVSFEDTLQQMHQSINASRDGTEVDPQMRMEDDAPILEDELMEMADTQMRTQLVSRALRNHFQMLRMGITGRSG